MGFLGWERQYNFICLQGKQALEFEDLTLEYRICKKGVVYYARDKAEVFADTLEREGRIKPARRRKDDSPTEGWKGR